MTNSIKTAKIIRTVVKYVVLVLLAVIFLFPVLEMIMKSFMTDQDIRFGLLFPTTFTIQPYIDALDAEYFWWLKNTIIIGVINMVGITFSSSLCAYGFSKLRFKGREVFFSIMLATLMLPAICMQIPLYKMYYGMGWTNSWLPVSYTHLTLPTIQSV